MIMKARKAVYLSLKWKYTEYGREYYSYKITVQYKRCIHYTFRRRRVVY